MNLQARLKRIETAVGIGQPCEECQYLKQEDADYAASLKAEGVKLHQPKEKDLVRDRCADCGQERVFDHTFFTPEARSLYAELVMDEKRDSKEWLAGWIRVYDSVTEKARDYYGPAFDRAFALTISPALRAWAQETLEAML